MTSLNDAPVSIRGWFAAEKSTDSAAGMRGVLSPDIVLDFGARRIRGIDAVVAYMAAVMPPGWLGTVEWSVLPRRTDGRVTVRGTGPGGALLPSPGGPMDAMDFTFTLDHRGLIVEIVPLPHHPDPDDMAQPLRPGEAGPDFVLPDVHGNKVSLEPHGARATVVIFVSNHCPWSLGWHARVQGAARDYAGRGVRFLSINPNGSTIHSLDSVGISRSRVAQGDFTGPYLIDDGQVVARRWGARHTPEVFVLDAQGVVAYHGAPGADVSDQSQDAALLRNALDHVLAGKSPDPAETVPIGCSIKWT